FLLLFVCSIIGYKGKSLAAPLLIDSLKRMEYRGYDSVGIATITDGKILVRKGVGKVAEVNKSLELVRMPGLVGIGHTRWATHGGVTGNNAHPHSACTKDIAVVHNGIIENYDALKEELILLGHRFKSQTDSEVIAHLLETHYSRERNIKQAMIETCKRLKGTYAFVAVFEEGAISGARFDEPLIIGIIDNGYFISSDILGFLKYTDKAIFLDNKDIAIVNAGKLELFDFEGFSVKRPTTQVAWELGAAEKGAYAHHTLKEIHEQVHTVIEGIGSDDKEKIGTFCNFLTNAKSIYITGSGTSYHSALILKHIFGKFAKIRSETIMSSEFQYIALDSIDETSVLIAISQSGETADVLQSVKAAKQKGAKILSVVNVPTSSLARISDSSLNVNCGPEIGVAATKSFTGQLSVLYNVTDRLCNGCVGIEANKSELIGALNLILAAENNIANMVNIMDDVKDIYILGRSLHYPIALEGALKIKELAYIHAEGIAAGELKHGPLALIDKNTMVVVINPLDATFNDTVSSAHEIKARGAIVIGISDKENNLYDHFIKLPKIKETLFPLIEVIPLQTLAYYLALKKNVDPDYPRNLAKSVTVK
ncbi:MAG TPA: glutamine--fructose-6-phosphate transaminase (isomerizing), partial [Nitrososphaeraceae archaeon]|nr:glutamine--fructose-6-phosphate transaminase (isomerizing) [Nitrososphaeraceae archaeon]